MKKIAQIARRFKTALAQQRSQAVEDMQGHLSNLGDLIDQTYGAAMKSISPALKIKTDGLWGPRTNKALDAFNSFQGYWAKHGGSKSLKGGVAQALELGPDQLVYHDATAKKNSLIIYNIIAALSSARNPEASDKEPGTVAASQKGDNQAILARQKIINQYNTLAKDKTATPENFKNLAGQASMLSTYLNDPITWELAGNAMTGAFLVAKDKAEKYKNGVDAIKYYEYCMSVGAKTEEEEAAQDRVAKTSIQIQDHLKELFPQETS